MNVLFQKVSVEFVATCADGATKCWSMVAKVKPMFVSPSLSKCTEIIREGGKFALQKVNKMGVTLLFLHSLFPCLSHLSKQISPELEQMLQIMDQK